MGGGPLTSMAPPRERMRRVYLSTTPVGIKEFMSVLHPATAYASINYFSQRFSDYMGGGYSFPLYQGRTAIYASLKALGIGEGDEVIVQSLVCPSVIEAILRTGARPALVDIEEGYWTMGIESLKERLSKKTKAAILIHTYGQPCDMGVLIEFAQDHGLRVIEDCAQAVGGEYHKKKLGTLGDASIFSLNVDKPITTGTGGIVYTSNPDLAGRISEVISGLQPCTFGERAYVLRKTAAAYLFSHPALWSYVQKILHLRNKLTVEKYEHNQIPSSSLSKYLVLKLITREAALFGLPQIGKIGRLTEQRNKNAQTLADGLKDFKSIELPIVRKNCIHAFMTYTVRLIGEHPSQTRKNIKAVFDSRGIDAGNMIWSSAIHQEDSYKELIRRNDAGSFPVTDNLVSSFMNIPIHPALNKNDLDNILDAIRGAI
jgi:perosamine synthetase